jgi:hypothetical protein
MCCNPAAIIKLYPVKTIFIVIHTVANGADFPTIPQVEKV